MLKINFTNTDLENQSFAEVNLSNSNFSGNASTENARTSYSIPSYQLTACCGGLLYAIRVGANMTKASFEMANLSACKMKHAIAEVLISQIAQCYRCLHLYNLSNLS